MPRDFAYPADGALYRHYAEGDFLDGQCVPLPHPVPDAAELAIATFFHMPGWVKGLMWLRNQLMRPFGLKTGGADGMPQPTLETIRDGTYRGIFAVHSTSPDEVVLGTDDRHLDFRVSILRDRDDDVVAISTWVHTHNILGCLYLAVVYPFHRIIVARCLANAVSLGVIRQPAQTQ